MAKTKSLKALNNIDWKTASIAAGLAIIVGFIIFRSFAATTLANEYWNSASVGHSYGIHVQDSLIAGTDVWQATGQSSKYSWFGPYAKHGSGHFTACYYVHVIKGGGTASMYVDVSKDKGRTKLASSTFKPADPNGLVSYDKYKYPYCLDYNVSGTTSNIEWRAAVKSGTINLYRIRVARISN